MSKKSQLLTIKNLYRFLGIAANNSALTNYSWLMLDFYLDTKHRQTLWFIYFSQYASLTKVLKATTAHRQI